jgi:hypothetical protein
MRFVGRKFGQMLNRSADPLATSGAPDAHRRLAPGSVALTGG